MNQTVFITIRVTPNQKERMQNLAEAEGHKTISSFIRKKLLEKNLQEQILLKEINDKLNQIIIEK